ncbi:DNA damage-inducible transcript 4-like protein [Poecilia reticulata]|uniref:DNA damage-inducible transcript 4-like protein n=1 Tax=Poecilia reticulata TaxID=8081 RepID=UPI0004A24926|nr:PREDICTED: DNA damage-inducible transcript 4-like protein [Poecilia reticulata]
MVYIAAMPFAHGVSFLTEEESVVEMIGKYFFHHSSPGRGSSSARRGSVESCDERDSNWPSADLDAGVEDEQRLLLLDLTRQIECCLTEAKLSVLCCQVLLLPRNMITRVGHHILHSSADEPCGLRGASIRLYVEGKDDLKYVGTVVPDPDVTPTFELSVVFKVDKKDGWHIFDSGKVLKLRPELRLVKRKLYSSESPVIYEFS